MAALACRNAVEAADSRSRPAPGSRNSRARSAARMLSSPSRARALARLDCSSAAGEPKMLPIAGLGARGRNRHQEQGGQDPYSHGHHLRRISSWSAPSWSAARRRSQPCATSGFCTKAQKSRRKEATMRREAVRLALPEDRHIEIEHLPEVLEHRTVVLRQDAGLHGGAEPLICTHLVDQFACILLNLIGIRGSQRLRGALQLLYGQSKSTNSDNKAQECSRGADLVVMVFEKSPHPAHSGSLTPEHC
ncbi:hypothetical protein ACFQU2_27615 [Siccirubricoccus deserti]